MRIENVSTKSFQRAKRLTACIVFFFVSQSSSFQTKLNKKKKDNRSLPYKALASRRYRCQAKPSQTKEKSTFLPVVSGEQRTMASCPAARRYRFGQSSSQSAVWTTSETDTGFIDSQSFDLKTEYRAVVKQKLGKPRNPQLFHR